MQRSGNEVGLPIFLTVSLWYLVRISIRLASIPFSGIDILITKCTIATAVLANDRVCMRVCMFKFVIVHCIELILMVHIVH